MAPVVEVGCVRPASEVDWPGRAQRGIATAPGGLFPPVCAESPRFGRCRRCTAPCERRLGPQGYVEHRSLTKSAYRVWSSIWRRYRALGARRAQLEDTDTARPRPSRSLAGCVTGTARGGATPGFGRTTAAAHIAARRPVAADIAPRWQDLPTLTADRLTLTGHRFEPAAARGGSTCGAIATD